MPFVFKLCSRQSGTVALTPSALPHHRSSPRSVWFDVEFFLWRARPVCLDRIEAIFICGVRWGVRFLTMTTVWRRFEKSPPRETVLQSCDDARLPAGRIVSVGEFSKTALVAL